MTQRIQGPRAVTASPHMARFSRVVKTVFATTWRCHAAGSIVCALLIGASIWVWTNPEIMISNATDDKRELIDAVSLLENADDWRRKYVAYTNESEALEQRKLAIKQWLPINAPWPSVDAKLRSVAADAGVEIVSLRPGDKHVGTRVGVIECECQLKGSYQSICELVQQLSILSPKSTATTSKPESSDHSWSYPMWCHHVRLQRIPVLIDSKVQCAATLTIRIPFAASGSASANIVKQETNDA